MELNKKSDILAAAQKEFTVRGYKKASVAHIAKEACVAVGTLYAYFGSKEGLFEALNQPELRRFNPDSAQKKREILKIARQVFGTHGYELTTMEAVAEACGFSKAVLYQYFNNKEALFVAIFAEPLFDVAAEHLQASASRQDSREFFMELGAMFLNEFEDKARQDLIRVVIAESGRFPEIGKMMYENTVGMLLRISAQALHCSAGELNSEKVLAVKTYFGILFSHIVTDRLVFPEKSQHSDQEIVKFAADLIENTGVFAIDI